MTSYNRVTAPTPTESGYPNCPAGIEYVYDGDFDDPAILGCDRYARWDFAYPAVSAPGYFGAGTTPEAVRITILRDTQQWAEGSWEQGAYPEPDYWTGPEISISIKNYAGQTKVLYDSREGGCAQTRGPGAGSLGNQWVYQYPTIYYDIPLPWLNGQGFTFSIAINGNSGDYWEIYETFCEVGYGFSHGYTTDFTPPTTTNARVIVAANMWNNNTGTFAAPSTGTAAQFDQEWQTIKPDPQDPETWYAVPRGYCFLTEAH